MRIMAIALLVGTAGCSGEAEQPKAAAPKVTAIQAGQWETVSEVTRLTPRKDGEPKINTPAGTRTTASICIAEADVKKPDAKLFMEAEDECTYNNFYMSGGTINATLRCTREGLNGQLMVAVFGDYKADSFETTRDVSTRLYNGGNSSVIAKVTGRRVGECTPAAPDAKAATG